MSTIIRDDKAMATGTQMLPWISAAVIGLTCASLVAMPWRRAVRPSTESLSAAVTAFDAGNLASGTAAFRSLADHGDAQAAYWYGHALDQGLGVPANGPAAIVQFEKAWNGGVVAAGTRLGEMYLAGNMVPQDFARAHMFLREAAQRGNARAALDLGRMTRDGIGAAANPVEAYAWLETAALHGNVPARAERDRLLASLTPAEQVAAAQQVTALPAPPENGHPAAPAKTS